MLILGLNGGFDPAWDNEFELSRDYVHDAAAVLLRDGQVVAAVEEERLNRIKHCNKTFFASLTFCLADQGLDLDDIDAFAIYVSEDFMANSLRYLHLHKPHLNVLQTSREFYTRLFLRELGRAPAPEKFHFVNHHHTHAMSAYAASGFGDSLVLAIDGAGEDISTLVAQVKDGNFEVLASKGVADSLGFFYLEVIRFLGYKIYDEYKVMGLAPYGDPSRFRDLMKTFYTLLPNGDYRIEKHNIMGLYQVLQPRKRGEDFNQTHKDIAAALQEGLEEIVFHVLTHWRAATGLDHLAMAGGVAQNSSMNGKLQRQGLFRHIYVPPSAADSGCALGAALSVARDLDPAWQDRRIEHCYWGPAIGDADSIQAELDRWSPFLSFRALTDRAAEVAALLAEGKVVGWVQGRSEFGPRSLGNRSILADPRRGSHRDTINAMIKKREAYRPFAPSVLAEKVGEIFQLPEGETFFPFMSSVMPVQEAWRDKLPAITHADGTARLQTVTRDHNPAYWNLISAFEKIAGVPVLLNTSFNNNAEPIVQTVEDAIVCFLTSGLDHLVAGDFIATKKAVPSAAILTLCASLPVAAQLVRTRRHTGPAQEESRHELMWNYDSDRRMTISAELYALLHDCDGSRPLAQSAAVRHIAVTEQLLSEIKAVWSERMVVLRP